MHKRKRNGLWAGTVVLGLVLAALVPAVASAVEGDGGTSYAVDGGSIDWGFKQSFRNYVPASGQSATDGATKLDDGTFRWTVTGGTYDASTGSLEVVGAGRAIFNYQAHMFVAEIVDPRVEISGAAGAINAQVVMTLVDAATGEVTSTRASDRVDLATIDPLQGSRVVEDGSISWTGIPAQLTAAGAEAFAADIGTGELTYFYSAGQVLDPLSLTLTGDWPAEAAGETWDEPGVTSLYEAQNLSHDGVVTSVLSHDAAERLISVSGTTVRVYDESSLELLQTLALPTGTTASYNYAATVNQATGDLAVESSATPAALGIEVANNGTVARQVIVVYPWNGESYGDPHVIVPDHTLQISRSVLAWDEGTGDLYAVANNRRYNADGTYESVDAGRVLRFAASGLRPAAPTISEGDMVYSEAPLNNRTIIIDPQTGVLFVRDLSNRLAAVALRAEGRPATLLQAAAEDTGQYKSIQAPLPLDRSTGLLYVSGPDGRYTVYDVRASGYPVVATFAASNLGFAGSVADGYLYGVNTAGSDRAVNGYDVSDLDDVVTTRLLQTVTGSNPGPSAIGASGRFYLGIYNGAVDRGVRVIEKAVTPSVVTGPVDATVELRADESGDFAEEWAEFAVEGAGSPAPGITWQIRRVNGWQDLSDGAGVQGSGTSTLRVLTGVTDDGTQYRAVLRNSATDYTGVDFEIGAIASDAATLSVSTAPVIDVQPTGFSVDAGSLAQFAVAASGNPTPTVTWQFDDGSGWADVSGDRFVVDGARLTVVTTAADDGARVRAKVSNPVDTVFSDAATLTVTGEDPSGPGEPQVGTGELTVTVPGGTTPGTGSFGWAWAGSSPVDLGTATLSGGNLVAAGSLNDVVVTDTRAGGPGGYSWTLSGSVGDFSDGTATFSGGYLGWTPKLVTGGTAVTAGQPVASTQQGGDGLAASRVLGSSIAAASATLGADLALVIPGSTSAGSYTATITLTAVS